MENGARGRSDRNFDTLVEAFERRIYGTSKGAWRLRLLQEDLASLREGAPLEIWDAGCGLGQMALWFAQRGHRLTCCDISEKMLAKSRDAFDGAGLRADFHQSAAQELARELPRQDLVLFHAVLEWLADPEGTLEKVSDRVKPGGSLSLLFFNYHGFIYRTALKGTWRIPFLLDPSKWWGRGKKLTPPHPQRPEEILSLLEKRGYTIVVMTGIRVFHDYLEPEILAETESEALFDLEYRYCREEPYRSMGRYIHILARKNEL